MKAKLNFFQTIPVCALALGLNFTTIFAATEVAAKQPQNIPWQFGAQEGADCHGDGLAVTSATGSAQLHCVFQRLDGEATGEGLWLVSTVSNTVADRFQV